MRTAVPAAAAARFPAAPVAPGTRFRQLSDAVAAGLKAVPAPRPFSDDASRPAAWPRSVASGACRAWSGTRSARTATPNTVSCAACRATPSGAATRSPVALSNWSLRFFNSRLARWNKAIRTLAILQHQPRLNLTGENASNIAPVVDARGLMREGRSGGFCLVLSDSGLQAAGVASLRRREGVALWRHSRKSIVSSSPTACRRRIWNGNLGR